MAKQQQENAGIATRRRGGDAAKAQAAVLCTKAGEYFAACDATRERVVLKNGEIRYRQTPYTLAGLSAAIGIPRTVLERARASMEADEGEDAVTAAIRCAVLRVEQHLVERTLLGELDTDMAAMLLEGWGYSVKPNTRAHRASEESVTEGQLTVVLEDPEGLSR